MSGVDARSSSSMTSPEQSNEVSDVEHDLDMNSVHDDVSMDIDGVELPDHITTPADIELDETGTESSLDSQNDTIHQTVEGSEVSSDEQELSFATNNKVSSTGRRKRNKHGEFMNMWSGREKSKKPAPRTHRSRDAYRKLLNEYIRSIINPTEAAGVGKAITTKVKHAADRSARPVKTQIGTTIWSPDEQDRLFCALSRYGIHNLPALAHVVSTKSMPEIRHYLNVIRTSTEHHELKGRRDRLWEGAAAIPAALEVGKECGLALDAAANHLRRREEKHDRERLDEIWGEWAVLDWVKATQLYQVLDVNVDGQQMQSRNIEKNNANGDNARSTTHSPDAASSDDDQPSYRFLAAVPSTAPLDQRLRPAISFLNIPNMLDLSARIFMNPHVPTSSGPPPSDHPNQDQNWFTMQSKRSRSLPSITAPCTLDFLNLSILFTTRLVSTALHIAMSRSRAQDIRAEYRGSPTVSADDVATACKVLKVNARRGAREWWRLAARRNRLRVVDTMGREPLRRGRKGMISVVGQKAIRKLHYSEVEKRLEVKEDGSTDDEDNEDGGTNEAGEPSTANEEDSSDQFLSLTSDEDISLSDTEAPSVIWSSSSSVRSPSPAASQNAELTELDNASPLPPQILAELEAAELETAHLDHLDSAASKAEEARLFALLKISPPATDASDEDYLVNFVQNKPPNLPPRKRKEPRELVEWYDNLLPPVSLPNRRAGSRMTGESAPGGEYVSEWQAYCGRVPAAAFVTTQQEWTQARKRKRKEEERLAHETQKDKRPRIATVDDDQDNTNDSDDEDDDRDIETDNETSDDKEEGAGDVNKDNEDNDDDADLVLDASDAVDDNDDLDDLLVQESDDSDDNNDFADGAPDNILDDYEQTANPDETSKTTDVNMLPPTEHAPQTTSSPPRESTTAAHHPSLLAPPAAHEQQSSPPSATRQPSRPRRQAAPSNLELSLAPLEGEEDAAWPAYLARRLGGAVVEEGNDSASGNEWVDA